MTTIAIASQKGGVAKTSTAAALTAWLHHKGKSVLCLDLDPQCSLSLVEGVAEKSPDFLDVMQAKAPAENAIISAETCSIIPGSRGMVNHKPTTANAVRSLLNAVEKQFDYAVLDVGPALDALTINALAASDLVLIPCRPDRFSLDALSEFAETIKAVKPINKALKAGVFFTMMNPRATANKMLKDQITSFADDAGIAVYTSYIRRSVTVEECQFLPDLFTYAPRSNPAQDYNALFKEVTGL